MDAEIAVDWMGEVLKALVRWFHPPKDMSGLPDALPVFDIVGVGGIGVAGGAGGIGAAGVDGVGWAGDRIFAPYAPVTPNGFPILRTFAQPIYDTETIHDVGQGVYCPTQLFTTDGTGIGGNDLEFDTVAGNL